MLAYYTLFFHCSTNEALHTFKITSKIQLRNLSKEGKYMKIGFIGAGNMAQAIIKGMLASGSFVASNIFLTASTYERAQQKAQQLGVSASTDNTSLVNEVDCLILAVKPNKFEGVLAELEPVLVEKQPIVVSIAAGLTLDNLANLISEHSAQRIIRVMPNMNVTIRKGVSALCSNLFVSEDDLLAVEKIFQSVGSTYRIEEKDFANFTSIAGCSPAYTYLFIDALSRAGVKNGLPKDIATKIAAETVLGSAETLLNVEDTPWDMIDKVCSPGGTTVAGLVALEDEKFISTVIKGLDATIKRDSELGK